MGDESWKRSYAESPSQVRQALLETVSALGYKVREDDQEGRVLFGTGLSIWSWSGQDMTATISPTESGGSTLLLTGALRRTGLGSLQLFSWGEKKRVARKVLDRLDERLAGAAAP